MKFESATFVVNGKERTVVLDGARVLVDGALIGQAGYVRPNLCRGNTLYGRVFEGRTLDELCVRMGSEVIRRLEVVVPVDHGNKRGRQR